MKKITDLEKFSLEHVWRPYQSLMGLGEQPLDRPPYGLNETARLLAEDTEWSRLVIDRLKAIGVCFPDYISHPLVETIRTRISSLLLEEEAS